MYRGKDITNVNTGANTNFLDSISAGSNVFSLWLYVQCVLIHRFSNHGFDNAGADPYWRASHDLPDVIGSVFLSCPEGVLRCREVGQEVEHHSQRMEWPCRGSLSGK